MSQRKKSSQEKFQSLSFYGAGSAALLSTAGGGYLGFTSTLVSSTLGAASLGVAGAAVGLVSGTAIGLGAYFAANAIYDNREYIAVGTALLVTLPIAKLGRALKSVKEKLFRQKKTRPSVKKNGSDITPSDLGRKTSEPHFTKSASNKPKNQNNPTPKSSIKPPHNNGG